MTVSEATIYLSDMNSRTRKTNTIWRRVDFDDLEINGPHTTTNLEDIAYHQYDTTSLTHPFEQVGRPPGSKVGGRRQRGFQIDLILVIDLGAI